MVLLLTWTFSVAGARVDDLRFTDITAQAGITFKHVYSPEKKYIVESMSGGVALFDYDNDGYLDIYFVNSLTVDLARTQQKTSSALYHNNGDGTFTDVTTRAGVGDIGFGMGVAAGDYNNDGFVDLCVILSCSLTTFQEQWQWYVHGRNDKGRGGRPALVYGSRFRGLR
jgi:hypothetical protein